MLDCVAPRCCFAFVFAALLGSAQARAQAADPELGAEPPPPDASAQPAEPEPFVIIKLDPPASAGEQRAPAHRLADDGQELELRPETRTEWYGWQTLTADATSIALMGLGASGEASGVVWVGIAGFLLVPPILHVVHENSWGYGSLALRLGSAGLLLGAVATAFADLDCDGDFEACDSTDTAVLAMGSLALALGAVISDAVLSRSKPSRPTGPSLSMWGDPTTASAGFSLTLVD